MQEKVFGVEEQEGDGAFRAETGEGYVAGKDGDYSKAKDGRGLRRAAASLRDFWRLWQGRAALATVVRLLGEEVQNGLSHAQYDQTSWSARYWRTYQTQRLSVVLARAARLQRSAWAVDPADRKAA